MCTLLEEANEKSSATQQLLSSPTCKQQQQIHVSSTLTPVMLTHKFQTISYKPNSQPTLFIPHH